MWAALAGAILFEVIATIALRASEGFRKRIWIVPVTIGYVVSFVLLWLTLKLGMHVGIAYGIWTACGVALVAVAARVLFREPLTWLMGFGIALIVAGVLTIERQNTEEATPARIADGSIQSGFRAGAVGEEHPWVVRIGTVRHRGLSMCSPSLVVAKLNDTDVDTGLPSSGRQGIAGHVVTGQDQRPVTPLAFDMVGAAG